MLRAGSKIQRIQPIPDIENIKIGPWWKLDDTLPKSRSAWRSDYAVLKKWNENNHYLNYTLLKDIPVWVGQAASQKVVWTGPNGSDINENCILTGGKLQIFLNVADIERNKLQHYNTNWK